MGIRYLHTMVRVKNLEASMAFYELLGLKETRRHDSDQGRFTLVFMAPEEQEDCLVELTYNWDDDDALPSDRRHFRHLAYSVDNILRHLPAFAGQRGGYKPPTARWSNGLCAIA